MGHTYLPNAAGNEPWQDRASRSTLARRLIRRYVADTMTYPYVGPRH